MNKIKALANAALAFFVRRSKCGPSNDNPIAPTYWDFKDNKPTWVVEVVRAAHEQGEMLCNDQRMEYIHAALERIATSPEEYNAVDYRQKVGGLTDHWNGQEDQTYTELADWWTSSVWRDSFVSSALQASGKYSSLSLAIQHGQRVEMARTFRQLTDELDRLARVPAGDPSFIYV